VLFRSFIEEKESNIEIAVETLTKTISATGIPLSLVYAGGTLGFSAAGITSGLSALALGAGMVPGIGVAVVGGLGIYKGLSYLKNKFKKSN
jgi:hypothetical protein